MGASKAYKSIFAEFMCEVFNCGIREEGKVKCAMCGKNFENERCFVGHELGEHFIPVVAKRAEVEKWPLNGRFVPNPRQDYKLYPPSYVESGIFTEDQCLECGVQLNTMNDYCRHLEGYHLAFIPIQQGSGVEDGTINPISNEE